MIPVIGQLGYWAAFLPLAACIVLMLREKPPRPDVVLLACAFFLSYIADTIGHYLQAHNIPNLWLAYLYAPLQFGLLVYIIASDKAVRNVTLFLIALCAAVSIPLRQFGMSEMVTQIVGGAFVTILAFTAPRMEDYRTALTLYCFGAIPFLWLMGVNPPAATGPWLVGYIGHQTVRIAALSLFTVAVLRRPRLKVVNGPGAREDVAECGSASGLRAGPHRNAVATAFRSRKTG